MLKQQFLTSLTDTFVIFTGVGQPQYDNLGDLRIEAGGAGQAVYKFVRFTGTTVTAIGDFLCYTDTSLQIADGANAAVAAGVAQAAVPGGAAGVQWIQVAGKATLNTNFSTAPAAGNKVTNAGAAAKTLKVAAALTDPQVGIAINTTNLVQLTLPVG